MKRTKLFLLLSLFVILMTVFVGVSAQDASTPAFKVSEVSTDQEVVLVTRNFPAETSYTVGMASPAEPESYYAVAKFNSKSGGALSITVVIPERFHGLDMINLLLVDENGGKIFGNFMNIPPAEPVIEEPVQEAADENTEPESPVDEAKTDGSVEETPAEETVSEAPAVTCNYTVIPTVSIDAVSRNQSVTFTTANFPANSTFSVSMGTYVATWQPEPMGPRPHGHRPEPRHREEPRPQPRPVVLPEDFPQLYVLDPIEIPVPGFAPEDRHHGPAPRPEHEPVVTTVFSGTEVGTFETGDGAPQTLTFTIPASLAGVNPIALWISDLGPCGFYSYNYFYNNSTN